MAEPSVRELMRVNRWNRIIPKCAIDIRIEPSYVAYLHPTKGWKYVSKKRLGVQTDE